MEADRPQYIPPEKRTLRQEEAWHGVDSDKLTELTIPNWIDPEKLSMEQKQAIISAQNIDIATAKFTIHGDHVYAEDDKGQSAFIPHDWANKFWGRSSEYRNFMEDMRRQRYQQELDKANAKKKEIPDHLKPFFEEMDRDMEAHRKRDKEFASSFYDQHGEFTRKEDLDFIDLSKALVTLSPAEQQNLLNAMPEPLRQSYESNKGYWQRLAKATNTEEFLEALTELDPQNPDHRIALDTHRTVKYTSNKEDALEAIIRLHPELPFYQDALTRYREMMQRRQSSLDQPYRQ